MDDDRHHFFSSECYNFSTEKMYLFSITAITPSYKPGGLEQHKRSILQLLGEKPDVGPTTEVDLRAEPCSFLERPGGSQFPCLSYLLRAAHIPWLGAPLSVFSVDSLCCLWPQLGKLL